MKKMVLALTLALLGLATLDVNAWRRYGRGYYNGGCRSACETSCAPACEPACEPACPKPCATFKKVIHAEACPTPPTCRRYVPVCEPAVCHEYRKCHWVCPESCSEVLDKSSVDDMSAVKFVETSEAVE